MDAPTQLDILARVAAAMLFGGTVGIEREYADKPAGFRTHMLVAGSAALFVGLTHAFYESFGNDARGADIRSDPIRVVEAIITGVSFLGAGTIFRRAASEHVEGLTTAATILVSAALGICVGLKQYVLAIGVTVLVLVVLRGLRFVEIWIERRGRGGR